MTQRSTVGYTFALCAFTALGFLSWYLNSSMGLFLAGIPAVLIAGFVGASTHNFIVGRNLFVAAFVGVMVACSSLFLAALLFGAVFALDNQDALRGGLFGGIVALMLFGLPVSVFGAISGLVAHWVVNKNQSNPAPKKDA